MSSFRRNDKVKFNDDCIDTRMASQLYPPDLSFPLYITVTRKLTPADIQAWRDSPKSKGMTSSGETKLPPQYSAEQLPATACMQIVKSRIAWYVGGTPRRGYALVKDNESGEKFYVKRKFLEKV